MRNTIYLLGLIAALGIVGGLIYHSIIKKEYPFVKLNYVITESGGPNSFDPLEGDKTNNLPVMRMLYATPLEVDSKNALGSNVLQSFSFDPEKKEITFTLRDGVFFDDGSPITIEDVALSISRVAYFKPSFPVVKDILGVRDWSSSKKGLATFPKGMRIEGQTLLIQLTKQSANPLFRFCLELFSIIPKNCVDFETGELLCREPAPSGYFRVSRRENNQIVFQRRNFNFSTIDPIQYETVTFLYKPLADTCKEDLDENTIVSGIEVDYLNSKCKFKAEQIHWMPSSRFGILRFNPNTGLFNNPGVRRVFAERVREVLRHSNSDLSVERGLFPKLLPGFLSNSDIKIEASPEDYAALKGRQITLPRLKQSGLKLIYDSIIQAAQDLGMTVVLIEDLNTDQILQSFLSGEIPVVAGSSGFWAQDPIGDISMWFTPNLHKTMTFAWSDKKIYSFIEKLESEPTIDIQSEMRQFNHYISTESVLMPVAHFKRFFVTSEKIEGLNIPQAITSPAPWQLNIKD